MTSKLTLKQDAFVKAYIVNGFNATQAAITAGYSKKTAGSVGNENLQKPEIAKAIDEHRKNLEKAHIWNKEKKLELLQKIATNGVRDVVDKDGNMKMENPAASVAAIKEHNLMQGDNAPTEIDLDKPISKIQIEVVNANSND